MSTKKIVALAVSRKPPSGRCVAGKVVEGAEAGRWIRPVSERAGREVSEEERQYENGKSAQVLDVITIVFKKHEPIAHQNENFVLDDRYYWVKTNPCSWQQVVSLCDDYDPDFWTQGESTSNGLNDKLSESLAISRKSSLKLIAVPELDLAVQKEQGFQGAPSRIRLRGTFEYFGKNYTLSVTDPRILDEYLGKGVGDYKINNVVMCVSLAEVWNGFAFRVIASVITANSCGESP